jgi:hypothetical protein
VSAEDGRHGVGHLDHVIEAGANDFAAALGIALLLFDGAVLVEAVDVLLGVVGSGERNSLGVDLGVEIAQLSGVVLNSARVGSDLGRLLEADDAHLKCVARVRARVVGDDGGGACVHFDGLVWAEKWKGGDSQTVAQMLWLSCDSSLL